MITKELLELRRKMKARKPNFVRQDVHKKPGLKAKWRKPKGLDSKLRRRIRGKYRAISHGYRSPREVRGIHKSGLEFKAVSSIRDLDNTDSKKQGIVISSTVGKKKRVEMLKMAAELHVEVLNIKNPEEYIKNAEAAVNQKKKAVEEKKKHAEKKEEKKEEKISDKVNEEEQKDAEKEEKAKVLTKRER